MWNQPKICYPVKHRWENRKPRLLEYLTFAQADIIGSQELQQDQLQEVSDVLGTEYSYYGEKTRGKAGRSDTNAIFYNPQRLELIEGKTIPYVDSESENAFTYCYFKDKLTQKNVVIINTKLTWGKIEERLAEAIQLSEFVRDLNTTDPVIVTGDFNTFPFLAHGNNIFFDGGEIEHILTEHNLKDSMHQSIFGHFGPLCSINNAKDTIEPFVGPELIGFMLDHIFVNEQVSVLTHGIDVAKVNDEFPSDHFPMITDVILK